MGTCLVVRLDLLTTAQTSEGENVLLGTVNMGLQARYIVICSTLNSLKMSTSVKKSVEDC